MGIKNLVDSGELPDVEAPESVSAPEPFYFPYVNGGIVSHSIRPPGRFFRPSFRYGCSRCMVLNYLGYPMKGADITGIKRMDSGTSVHDKWEKYFKQSGILFSTKHRIWTADPPFSGEPDFVILNHETLQFYLIELKSREMYAFSKQSGALGGHILQWSLYAWMVSQFYGIPIEKGWIHYEELNFQAWKAFSMVLDKSWLEGVLKKYREWAAMGDKREIPAMECSGKPKGDKKFRWCPANIACLKLAESGA